MATQNVDVPRSKSLSMDQSWKTHDNNEVSCSYQSMGINRTLSFCRIFFTMVPTAVLFVEPTSERHIFLHNMDSIRIIIRKEIQKIRRGGKITNIIVRGNIYGSWKQILVISSSFMRAGSITNGDGRQVQIWTTKLICKGIIEAVIKLPVVVLQCSNFLIHISLCNTRTV